VIALVVSQAQEEAQIAKGALGKIIDNKYQRFQTV